MTHQQVHITPVKVKDVKPKILLLTWEFPPHIVGGLARHVQGLAGGLNKHGYEVHVVTANPGELIHEELAEGIYVHRVRPLLEKDPDFLHWISGLNLAMEEKARELAQTHRFEIVQAHDWLVGVSALSIRDSLDIPLISTIHATEHGRNNGIYTELQKFIHEKERQLINASDNIIVCSEYMKEELMHIFNVSEQKLWIIPNGADQHNEFDEEILSCIPPYPNRRLIFSVGRMVKEKGFDTLIDAASLMKDICPDVYFIIAGKGPLLEEYRNKVAEMKLEDNVFFPGFISDEQKNTLFNKCTLAVFPSLYEPFGIVALEAMIAAKPVIVSNTGGLKGIVQHANSGFLMKPNDPESFIKQAAFLLENEQMAEQIGSNGKRVVESLFSWNRIAEETKRVFKEAMINHRLEEDLVK